MSAEVKTLIPLKGQYLPQGFLDQDEQVSENFDLLIKFRTPMMIDKEEWSIIK